MIQVRFDKLDEKKILKIICNNKRLFPRCLNNEEISVSEYLLIFKMIFLGSFAEEHTKLSLFTIRMIMIHSYFEKIQQSKFRGFFDNFKSAYQNWCNKEDCHILPFSSNFKLNSLFSIDYILDKSGSKKKDNDEIFYDPPHKRGIIKGIIDEKKDEIQFVIKGVHDSSVKYLESSDGVRKVINLADVDDFLFESDSQSKYGELLVGINEIFVKSIREKSKKIKGNLDDFFSDFEEEEEEEIKQKITKAYQDFNRIQNCRNILWEIYFLIEKVEKLNEFNFPTDDTSQYFESFKEFKNNKNIKSFQDIIEFQFFTYLRSVNPISFKNVFLKSGLSDWYEEWVQTLIEFHNNENTELEQLVETGIKKF